MNLTKRNLLSSALLGLALTALFPVFAPGEDNSAVKKDVGLLQGEWMMLSGSADGQIMPEPLRKQMKRVCEGDLVTVTMGGQIYVKAKFTIDPSKSPKIIDYEMTDGFTKGKRQLGIYEVEGDTLRACYAPPGKETPTEFAWKEGSGS